MRFRYDIINHLIEKHGYTRYLEIGLAQGETFRAVRCEHKESVDVVGRPTHLMTSDVFFATHTDSYDIIFVDGDHSTEQARRDIMHALCQLADGGCVVVHDCNPTSEAMAADEDNGGCWMGGVYKTIARLRADALLSVVTVDADCGVAVIEFGHQTLAKVPDELTYAYFDEHRVDLLNLISVEEFVHDNG